MRIALLSIGRLGRLGPPLAIALLCAVLLTSCAPETPKAPATAAAPGGSMMGGGGSGEGMTDGVIAAAANANLTLGAMPATPQGILIDNVMAPDDGWIVVRSVTAPGAVLGRVAVKRGETRGLMVPLDALDGIAVRVALHVDRGERGTFEFDAVRPGSALDKPVFADDQAIERLVPVPSFAIEAVPNSVLILVSDQRPTAGNLEVRYLLVPGPSWILVSAIEDGLPGRRIGLAPVSQGEWHKIAVRLDDPPTGAAVLVTVLADRGVLGRFDRDEGDPLGSADRPYASAGVVVASRITLD